MTARVPPLLRCLLPSLGLAAAACHLFVSALAIFCAGAALSLTALGTPIVGSLQDVTGNAYGGPFNSLQFVPFATAEQNGTNANWPSPGYARLTNGVFAVNLVQGFYNVSPVSIRNFGPGYHAIPIYVPNDTNVWQFNQCMNLGNFLTTLGQTNLSSLLIHPGTNMVFVTNTDGSVTISSSGGGGGGSSIGYITQVAGAQNTNLIVVSGFGTGNANGNYTNIVPGLAWTNMLVNGFNIQPGLLGSWMIASNAVQYYYGGGTDPISTEGAYHNQFAAGAGPAFQPVLWGNYYSLVTNYISGQAVLQGGTNVIASGSGSAIVFSVPPNTFDPAGAAAAVGATAITATTQPLTLANSTITVDSLGYTALNGYAVVVPNLYATGTNITGIPIPNLVSNGLPVAPVAGQVATFTVLGTLVASNPPAVGGANSNTFTGSLNIGQLYGGLSGASATNSFQPTNASLSLWSAFTPASYGLISSNSFDPTNSAFNALKQATNSFQPTNANLSLWSATTPAAYGLVSSNSFQPTNASLSLWSAFTPASYGLISSNSFDPTNSAFNALKQATNSFQPTNANLSLWAATAPASFGAGLSVAIATNIAPVLTNFIVGMIDAGRQYQSIVTNQPFAFVNLLSNLTATAYNATAVDVTNSSGAPIAVTPAASWHVEGVWIVTNVTEFSVFAIVGRFTNVIAFPLW